MQRPDSFPTYSFMRNLKQTEMDGLVAIAHKNTYIKGDYIFQASQLNDSIFILLDGRVKITRLSNEGRELIQWFCLPGEIFGLSEDRHIPYRGIYAQALLKSKLLVIPKKEFNQYLISHPHLALLIIKQLASRLRTLGDMLLHMSSDDALARFLKLLQRLCNCYGREDGSSIHIDIHLTHQEMADMIGVCRQTVSTMLGSLRRQGRLTADRNGIHIEAAWLYSTIQQTARNTSLCRQLL